MKISVRGGAQGGERGDAVSCGGPAEEAGLTPTATARLAAGSAGRPAH